MLTPFQKMRAHRSRWVSQPIKAQEAATQPVMVVDGVAYVEAPEVIGCKGCAFQAEQDDDCFDAANAGERAFSGRCSARRVIYIKAE